MERERKRCQPIIGLRALHEKVFWHKLTVEHERETKLNYNYIQKELADLGYVLFPLIFKVLLFILKTFLLIWSFTEPIPKCATRASRYGCCWDNKTEAKSYAGEGCPGKKKKLLIILLLFLLFFPWQN